MVKVSVDKLKPAMADHFLHKIKRLGSFFSLRPTMFGHFFRGTDAFINQYLMDGPLEIGSMFPSLFDGIRSSRQRTTAQHLRQSNDSNQRKSNFRIIPITVEGRENNGKAQSKNKGNPIVLDDDDDAEIIDITGESSSSHFSQSKNTFNGKQATVDSAVPVSDDSVATVKRSTNMNKANVRSSQPIRIVEPASSKNKIPNKYSNHSEKISLPVSDDTLDQSERRMRIDSFITVDDDQEIIQIDDTIHDSECLLQQSSDSADVHKENIQKDVQLKNLKPERRTTPNRKSTSAGADTSEVDCCSLVKLNIEDTDDVRLLGTEITTNPGLSEAANCRVQELKPSPPPDYPVYEEVINILALEDRKIHYITGDGNCFFRALCEIVYGCETYHAAVRNLIVDIIATNKSKFAQFVDENDVQAHVQKMSQDHCWATTCEIYAAATLLQRDIYVLTPHPVNRNYCWLLFKPVFKNTHVPVSFAKQLCYITLCNTNGNHYDLVVADHGKCNCFLPCPELDGISASIDLTQ